MQKPFKFKQLALYGGLASTSVLVMAPASEAATIWLDQNTLYAATNQQLQLLISGTENIEAATVDVQINDGGVYNYGVATGPLITDIDLTTASSDIFHSNNNGNVYETVTDTQITSPPYYDFTQSGNGTPALMAYATTGVSTVHGTVPDNGTLATITLNTSGMTAGNTFTIQFFDVENNQQPGNGLDSQVYDASGNPITPGGVGASYPYAETITIVNVPEPATALLVIPSASLAMLRRERRRSRRQD